MGNHHPRCYRPSVSINDPHKRILKGRWARALYRDRQRLNQRSAQEDTEREPPRAVKNDLVVVSINDPHKRILKVAVEIVSISVSSSRLNQRSAQEDTERP